MTLALEINYDNRKCILATLDRNSTAAGEEFAQ